MSNPDEIIAANRRKLHDIWKSALRLSERKSRPVFEVFDCLLLSDSCDGEQKREVAIGRFRFRKEALLSQLVQEYVAECELADQDGVDLVFRWLAAATCKRCGWQLALAQMEELKRTRRIAAGWYRSVAGPLRSEALARHAFEEFCCCIGAALAVENRERIPQKEQEYFEELFRALFPKPFRFPLFCSENLPTSLCGEGSGATDCTPDAGLGADRLG